MSKSNPYFAFQLAGLSFTFVGLLQALTQAAKDDANRDEQARDLPKVEPLPPRVEPFQPMDDYEAKTDVIFSTHATSGHSKRAIASAFPGAKILDWAGAGPGHPSWTTAAARLRDSEGRLLPALLRSRGLDPDAVGRIGAMGFSAGSNNGLREIIRHPEDFARLNFAVGIDGAHWNRKASGAWGDTAESRYFDWAKEADPFAHAAREGAAGGGPLVIFTASNVARPGAQSLAGPHLTKTREALDDATASLELSTLSSGPLVEPLAGSYRLEGRERDRVVRPERVRVGRRLVVGEYEGNQREDHIDQAWILLPWLLENVVAPHWSRGVA